jgi:lipoprotein-anchoring transpeptidase ErfK/SrfK
MGRHRDLRDVRGPAPARPRYTRLGAAGVSLTVTLVALLGGVGVLPVEPRPSAAAAGLPQSAQRDASASRDALALASEVRDPGGRSPDHSVDEQLRLPTVPANSGTGRRVVFAMADQRVWLVDDGDVVRRTYLVSGSVTDNLAPGTYEVYSKSEQAWGIDDSGTMRYMVRFAHGHNAAIGFHDIPVDDGERVQTRAELGTPRSHGCIRQWRPDAKALWDFAPVGTEVAVVA